MQNRQQNSASSLLNNFGHPRRAITPTRRNVQRNKHQRSRSYSTLIFSNWASAYAAEGGSQHLKLTN